METVEDGWIMIECPVLPGFMTQRKDEQEVLANIEEAITGWLLTQDDKALDSLSPDKVPVPVLV
jgi:predicted RNase H-like HicB family nuclease